MVDGSDCVGARNVQNHHTVVVGPKYTNCTLLQKLLDNVLLIVVLIANYTVIDYKKVKIHYCNSKANIEPNKSDCYIDCSLFIGQSK